MLACTEARFIQSLLFITYVNVFRGTGARHYTFGHDGCDSCLTQIITHLDEKVSVESDPVDFDPLEARNIFCRWDLLRKDFDDRLSEPEEEEKCIWPTGQMQGPGEVETWVRTMDDGGSLRNVWTDEFFTDEFSCHGGLDLTQQRDVFGRRLED